MNTHGNLYYTEDDKTTLILGYMKVTSANLFAMKRNECVLLSGTPR